MYFSVQVATQGILKYCLRDMLGKKQQDTLSLFLDAITMLLFESFDHSKIKETKLTPH